MKYSVFTPLPPANSGIADYSKTLLNELYKRGLKIEAFTPKPYSAQSFPIRSPKEFKPSGRTLFQVGNSEYHNFLYPYLFKNPDILVLHDLAIHHSRLRSYLHSEDVTSYRNDLGNSDKRSRAQVKLSEYREEVVEAYPTNGAAIAEIALHAGGGRLLYDYPLYEHLVRKSSLTLVHNTTAKLEITERCPKARVRRIRMGIPMPKQALSREEACKSLGISPEGYILASFGLVTPEKRISMVLQALTRLRAQGINVRYLVVGATVDHYDAQAEAISLGVENAVQFTGRVSADHFWRYACAADICLNLRYPSAGETSATLLHLLACGRPVMVTEQLHSEDFPQKVVARTQLEGDADGLYCDLMDLLLNFPLRRELSENAHQFISCEHTVDVMVNDYLEALSSNI